MSYCWWSFLHRCEFGHKCSVTATEIRALLVQNMSKSKRSLSITIKSSAEKVMKNMCDWHCFFFLGGKVTVYLAVDDGLDLMQCGPI